MTTGTLTRTDFLLARIAEWESLARDMQDQARLGRPFIDPATLAGGTLIRDLIDPERILAEREAMRRIVEWSEETGDATAAMLLAAIWSDHADYREEWRA